MNKFGLDDYTYDLLIEYFKSKPSIKFVRIFGSRTLGKARHSSDLDLLVEGTYPEFMLPIFLKEINELRHPYRIDMIDINTKDTTDSDFVSKNYATSEYFYNSKDYYPLDTYEGKNDIKVIDDERKRWQRRYQGNFHSKYLNFKEQIKQLDNQLENGIEDINFQIKLFEAFKSVFEGLWKTLKDYYKEQGIKIFMPRQLLKRAVADGILPDFDVWSMMIYDFNVMTDEPYVSVKDELIYRLKNNYLRAIEDFNNYFSKLYAEEVNENVTK
ncbi:nucleotidyltransferase substrate binding protein [bacterium]|nr:nucleotidyltransferase substrate binding protein [bacterium]